MPVRVLLVGAAGVFGRKLAEQLVCERGVSLVLTGRTRAKLDALAGELGGGCGVAPMDRNTISANHLLPLSCDIVIDAAGPFRPDSTALVSAAIDAGCHYIDLADDREFVTTIGQFDAAARQMGAAVLAGASSTPALSHAVVDALIDGWSQVETITVAISPGNRAPRGLSVVQSILSWAGQPVKVYSGGRWTTAPGWGLTHDMDFPGIGSRLVSLCNTPDLDLLVERYKPTQSAVFLAGLELRSLHRTLELTSRLVRIRLLPTLAPFARPARQVAALLQPFGTDTGGMVVEIAGRNAAGQTETARWSLTAKGGKGPYVPTLAALALVRTIRDGGLSFKGAKACTGILTLDDFKADFDRLGIETRLERL